MKMHITLMLWQLSMLTLEGLQRIPRTASPSTTLEIMNWSLCNAKVYNNLGGLGGRNEAGTDLSNGKKEMRFFKIGKTSEGAAVDLVVTNTTEYVPNPRTPKAAREAKIDSMGGEYFNGLKECIGVFNIDSPSKVTLKFSIMLSGTDEVANNHLYNFSIFDWDMSANGIQEVITVQGIDSYRQSWATPLEDGDIKEFQAFRSSIEVDNPTNPNNLTDAQKNASVGFVYSVSEWEITFEAREMGNVTRHAGHPGGRNYHFGPGIDVPTDEEPIPQPPCPANASTTVDWNICEGEVEVYNNLGGMGGGKKPGADVSSGKQEMRFKKIGTIASGEELDLVITNTTEYRPNPVNPKDARRAGYQDIGGQYFNGQKGCMGVFNIEAASQVKLKFSMVLTGTDTLAPAGSGYDLTIYDFDKSMSGVLEQIVVEPRGIPWVQVNDSVLPIPKGDDSLTFSASASAREVENPAGNPCDLTPAQAESAVGFYYFSNEWEITFNACTKGNVGDEKGRNFLFSGRSVVQGECNPKRPLTTCPKA